MQYSMIGLCCVLAAAVMRAGAVSAQEAIDAYPSKPVTIIIAGAGPGSLDVEFRLYAQSIQQSTGRQFIIDFKPGAAGTIGYAYVAKSAPDGYTLGAVNPSFATGSAIYPNLPYDNVKDFAPIALLTMHVFFLVVHPSAPFKTVQQYIAYARAHPTEINFSTGGVGGPTHLPGELLHHMTGTKVTFVHYKTTSQRYLDLMAGLVHATTVTPVVGMGHIKAGKLRAIGVTSNLRTPVMPNLPTVAEQGVPGYEFTSWYGLVAPGRTSPAIVNKLNTMFVTAGKDPGVIKKITFDGTLIIDGPPEAFRKYIVTETQRWNKVIKDAGIKMELE